MVGLVNMWVDLTPTIDPSINPLIHPTAHTPITLSPHGLHIPVVPNNNRTMWRKHGDNVEKTRGQCGDHRDVETMWGPRGCVDHVGTTWGQHEDNVETTWGPQGCGDHVGTMWRQHGDNVGTTGMWRPHGDNMETTWGQHEDNVETT